MPNTAIRTIASTASKASASARSATTSAPTRVLRMRVIVNQKGLIYSSRVSTPRPAAASYRSFQTSAPSLTASKLFYPEVSSQGATIAMAGSNRTFESEYRTPGTYYPAPEKTKRAVDEFKVGTVQTASNVVYSNKHSE